MLDKTKKVQQSLLYNAMQTCQRTWNIWFWQSIFYAHTVIATVFTEVLRVNCDAAQKHTLGRIQGSYVTWAGPWRTWFYYTGPVTHIASPSASFRRTLEDMQRGTEPDWTAVRQAFPPVNPVHRNAQWCEMSPEACGVEMGERAPNVTHATLISTSINYHNWHDGCHWIL